MLSSAWHDFWHIMWMLRLAWVVLALIALPLIGFAALMIGLGRDWR